MNSSTDEWLRAYDSAGSSAPATLPPPRRKIWTPDALPEPDPPDGGLPFLTIAELLDRPDDATEWLVDGILPASGLSALAGKPKSGKSTAARHLAHTVSTGERWLDRDTATGPVLYLALEEKVSEVRRHFMALGTPRDAPLHVCFHRTPGGAAELLGASIAATKPALVVIDTLFRFQPVHDTSAYGDVLKALAPLQEVARETGAHVMVVHHERKAVGEGGDRVLGSQAIFGTVDVLVSIERRHGEDVRVISTIGRYGEDLPETVLGLQPDGSLTLAGAPEHLARNRANTAVLAWVEGNPGATRNDIRDAGLGRAREVQMAVTSLHKDGRLVREGAGRAGDAHRYYPAPDGGNRTSSPEGQCPVPPYLGAEPDIFRFREPAGTGGTGPDGYRVATRGE